MEKICQLCGSPLVMVNYHLVCPMCGTEAISPEEESQIRQKARTLDRAKDYLSNEEYTKAQNCLSILMPSHPSQTCENSEIALLYLRAATKDFKDYDLNQFDLPKCEAAWNTLRQEGILTDEMIRYARNIHARKAYDYTGNRHMKFGSMVFSLVGTIVLIFLAVLIIRSSFMMVKVARPLLLIFVTLGILICLVQFFDAFKEISNNSCPSSQDVLERPFSYLRDST